MLCTELLEVLWNRVWKRDDCKILYDNCIGSVISFKHMVFIFKFIFAFVYTTIQKFR